MRWTAATPILVAASLVTLGWAAPANAAAGAFAQVPPEPADPSAHAAAASTVLVGFGSPSDSQIDSAGQADRGSAGRAWDDFVGRTGLKPAGRAQSDSTGQAQFDSAYYAWQAGDYPDALRRLERLLTGPYGDAFLEPVALLTGELYRTVEIAADGANVRWGPDGRYAAYETGADSSLTTHVVTVEDDGVRLVASVHGDGLVLSPAMPEAAYLRVERTAAFERALDEQLALVDQARTREEWLSARMEVARLEAEQARVVAYDLESGRDRAIEAADLAKYELAYAHDGHTLYLIGAPAGSAGEQTDIYALSPGAAPQQLTDVRGHKSDLVVVPGGRHLVYSIEGDRVGVLELATGATRAYAGIDPAVSADGSTLVFVGDPDAEVDRGDDSPYAPAAVELAFDGIASLNLLALDNGLDDGGRTPIVLDRLPVENPALSPDGSNVVYQVMYRDDWELESTEWRSEPIARRLTHEIQHDLFPRFLPDGRVLGIIGEGRHRRSYLYDVETGERTRLFHNNTVRTVAPEYEWAVSPDGTKVLIVSERDGNTVSPERGVYLTDLTRTVTKDELLDRIRTSLAQELALRERGREMFAPIAEAVRDAVADVSVGRIYGYAKRLHAFGSKYITEPGNAEAIEYLTEKLRSFGYEPELQWFEPRGLRTANVIVTLPGTTNPELVYVVSSHFDSSSRGPGADDNSSGTTALLEAARVLRNRPQGATIQFAFFTGEEAGLLGSREFVRRAVAEEKRIVGALNNDMVGWANDERLDNTIRYSNAGIRDLQHSAAFLFTDLITYDAEYYKSTDAHAYYEVYGDIVGGIGSYPILGNPHYHRSHDVLETINQQLVAEVCKTTVASLMLLASSPSRLHDLELTAREGGDVEVRWAPAAEKDVTGYVVAYGPEDDPMQQTLTVDEARAMLREAPAGTHVAVKALNARGLAGWDWARTVVRQQRR